MGRWYILGGPPEPFPAAAGCGVGLPLEDIAAAATTAPRARAAGDDELRGGAGCVAGIP
jgi:hypothetical protein